MSEQTFTATVGNDVITFKTGLLAQQAGGAVTLEAGDSQIFATATMSKSAREGLNFFPLSVDFEEKIYAEGRIPGSFFRREGRATTPGILVARVTDRSLRPLFPDGMRNEVQIIAYALSSDKENHLDVMSMNAASAALTISDVPWDGPIGAVRIGYIDGELVVNPKISDMENSSLNLRIAGTRDAILMVEAGANEATEELMVEALVFAHQAIQPIIDTILEMKEAVGKEKSEIAYAESFPEVEEAVKAAVGDRVMDIVAANTDRKDRGEAVSALRDEIAEVFVAEDEEANVKAIHGAIDTMVKYAVRERILQGIRPDGRDTTTIRELTADTGITKRTHGSGLFKRGETQVLSLATLGTARDAQKIDGLFPEDEQKFMHHYNFPPFSTGETWFLRGPKRREIGHGELARQAILPVIPEHEDFPYTIRVVSEILSSNGSTSQGSICASVLALLDAGVPLKKSVAGIAMGLITEKEGDRYSILTDIQGLEDHIGDMDFKVAGTKDGITAIQMDIKIDGLSPELMSEALGQAKQARLEILNAMNSELSAPREELSEFAPRLESISINPEKIGAVIGKGGATIRSLEEEFEVSIDIQEDGTITVAGVSGQLTKAALTKIELLTKEVEAGETYTGKVVRIVDFGAFIELIPGTDGMLHISQISTERVESVESVFQMGDEVMVMVTDVDPAGKIRLSRKAVLEGWTLEEARENDKPRGGGGNRGGRDRRGGGGRDRRGGGGRR